MECGTFAPVSIQSASEARSGAGQVVLVAAGALRGKAAAGNDVAEKFARDEFPESQPLWRKEGVVVSGQIITAAGPKDAPQLARLLLEKLRPDP